MIKEKKSQIDKKDRKCKKIFSQSLTPRQYYILGGFHVTIWMKASKDSSIKFRVQEEGRLLKEYTLVRDTWKNQKYFVKSTMISGWPRPMKKETTETKIT